MIHQPVLLKEIIAGLNIQAGETLVDATINRGGHAKVLGQYLGSSGRLIGIDQDGEALKEAEEYLGDLPCQKILIQGNFRQLKDLLADRGIVKIDRALFDLGWSSDQLENSGRGFSFLREEPLLMTLGNDLSVYRFTAKDIVNEWEEESLVDILTGYGEEVFARRIAHAIIKARQVSPITTTTVLATIVSEAVPFWYRRRKIHPATKTFQALRIAVNDELGALKDGLSQVWDLLNSNGRLAVISFHSLEARIVKLFFLEKEKGGEGKNVFKKAVKPSREEEIANPRSRSAQLRVLLKN